MRAMLLLEQESHWKLTKRDREGYQYREGYQFCFDPPIRFFFPSRFGRSLVVDRVACVPLEEWDINDERTTLEVTLYSGSQKQIGFMMPVGIVWIAGEVEL